MAGTPVELPENSYRNLLYEVFYNLVGREYSTIQQLTFGDDLIDDVLRGEEEPVDEVAEEPVRVQRRRGSLAQEPQHARVAVHPTWVV